MKIIPRARAVLTALLVATLLLATTIVSPPRSDAQEIVEVNADDTTNVQITDDGVPLDNLTSSDFVAAMTGTEFQAPDAVDDGAPEATNTGAGYVIVDIGSVGTIVQITGPDGFTELLTSAQISQRLVAANVIQFVPDTGQFIAVGDVIDVTTGDSPVATNQTAPNAAVENTQGPIAETGSGTDFQLTAVVSAVLLVCVLGFWLRHRPSGSVTARGRKSRNRGINFSKRRVNRNFLNLIKESDFDTAGADATAPSDSSTPGHDSNDMSGPSCLQGVLSTDKQLVHAGVSKGTDANAAGLGVNTADNAYCIVPRIDTAPAAAVAAPVPSSTG